MVKFSSTIHEQADKAIQEQIDKLTRRIMNYIKDQRKDRTAAAMKNQSQMRMIHSHSKKFQATKIFLSLGHLELESLLQCLFYTMMTKLLKSLRRQTKTLVAPRYQRPNTQKVLECS